MLLDENLDVLNIITKDNTNSIIGLIPNPNDNDSLLYQEMSTLMVGELRIIDNSIVLTPNVCDDLSAGH